MTNNRKFRDQPFARTDECQVIPFPASRIRARALPTEHAANDGESLPDPMPVNPTAADPMAVYEQPREPEDDFRHRIIVNVAAIILTGALLVAGIWLATSISELRDKQDCVLMGRRDCARIAPPAP